MRRPLSEAADFAAERHAWQTYGDGPYTVHLRAADQVLERFGILDEEIRAAAWLHDVVEDTETTVEEIAATFGARVSLLVWAVTNEPGKNRAERHAKSYPKIKTVPGAIFVKLADRTANVEASAPDSRHFKMYQKEHPSFRAALYDLDAALSDQTLAAMWAHLDVLLERAKS